MNKEQKTAVVEEVAAQIQGADAVFAVDYRGISVPQVAALRQQLLDAGARFRVVKNTLTLRAAEQAGADDLKGLLEGPTAFTFVAEGGDVALAAKALAQFRRENDLLDFKGGRMNGEPLTVDQIQDLARLPAREVLHAQLVGTLASPVTGLVRGLNQLIAGLALQLGQIAEQGLVSGEAPTAEAPAAEEPAAEDAPATPDPDEADLADGDEAAAEPADAEGGTDEPDAPADAEEAAEPAAADAEGGTDEPETPSEGEEQKEG